MKDSLNRLTSLLKECVIAGQRSAGAALVAVGLANKSSSIYLLIFIVFVVVQPIVEHLGKKRKQSIVDCHRIICSGFILHGTQKSDTN
jgi:hypothetical protein